MDDSRTATTSFLNRSHIWVFVAAVLGLLALQLPWISRPPFDAHGFRQAQTLSTIELFVRDGIDLAHAKTNYVGEPGVFVLEFPLFQAFCALLYGWFGPHVWIVRLLNLLVTFGNAGLTFAIARRIFGREAAFASMILYLLAPLNLVYMTSTLFDPSAIFCSLGVFLFALRILYQSESEGAAGFGTWAAFALACVLTAMTKTLYLFPTCVLLAATFLARRKISAELFAAGLCVVVAVGLFLLWLRHSRHVNDASYFTRGINPTTLLGFKPLTTIEFYQNIGRRVLLHLMGPGGTLLAGLAIMTTIARRTATARNAGFWVGVLTVSVFGYLLAFAPANFPHDYYSLIVSPHACIVAGLGAAELTRRAAASRIGLAGVLARPAAVVMVAAGLSAFVFVKRPRIVPDASLLDLQRLSEGRFERWSFGMVFFAPDRRLPLPPNVGSDMPEALYATGLRGTGRMVVDGQSALAVWNEKRPHYEHLKYAVFYRLKPPPEIVQACREVIVADEAREWFAYRVE